MLLLGLLLSVSAVASAQRGIGGLCDTGPCGDDPFFCIEGWEFTGTTDTLPINGMPSCQQVDKYYERQSTGVTIVCTRICCNGFPINGCGSESCDQ